jgi:uncharacterized protein YndB with AHSA1/START domain
MVVMGLIAYKGGWVKAGKTSVHHWRFEDGKTSPNLGGIIEMDPPPRGWYCWVYPEDNEEFEAWMKKNCPTADCIRRFNSGDPMTTVYIREDREATLFQLKWL